MPGGLDLLLLLPDLDDLLVLELLQLVLGVDEEVVLHGAGLGGDGVQDGGHVLAVHDRDGEVSGGLDKLGLQGKLC